MQVLKSAEKALFVGGIAVLGFVLVAYMGGRFCSRMSVTKFRADTHSAKGDSGKRISFEQSPVDFSLWSEKRIHEYQASLAQQFDQPLAVLRIEKIRLEVAVFDGTDDLTLNRGVGRIIGTARLGEAGNVGIAGHRDGFFRGLKDISVGDTAQLETRMGTQMYTIDSIQIVGPKDVSVLKNEAIPSLTLVTCYPFYFIGSAPQRYIVHASLRNDPKSTGEAVKASFRATDSRSKENTQ